MKKIIISILALITLCGVVTSCTKDKNEPNNTNNQQENKEGQNEYNGYDYVDLGLSVKWATCNIGADKPEDYGYYYMWGGIKVFTGLPPYLEVIRRDKYGNETYIYSKYCTNSEYGTVDNKTTLELMDDAAQVNWGGVWRMPTYEEFNELITNCSWVWTTENQVTGYKVKGKNGNYIFLPAAGRFDVGDTKPYQTGSRGYYWSSSLYTYNPNYDNPNYAYYLSFQSAGKIELSHYSRDMQFNIRPVCP